jgi:hypothetical protein
MFCKVVLHKEGHTLVFDKCFTEYKALAKLDKMPYIIGGTWSLLWVNCDIAENRRW